MQETEEMTTFGTVWKHYKPTTELVRCKDCLNYNPERTNECFLHDMHTESDEYCSWAVKRER